MRLALLKDIEKALLDEKAATSNILRNAKVLAYKLHNEQFKTWVERELNGYLGIPVVNLPDYRKFHVHSVGLFWSPGMQVTRSVPTWHLDENFRKYVEELYLNHALYALEQMRFKSDEHRKIPWEAAFVEVYNQKTRSSQGLVGAWKPLPSTCLDHVIETVRNRLLTFILELESLDPAAGEIPSLTPETARAVTQIFIQTILGPGSFANNSPGASMATGDQNTNYGNAGNVGGKGNIANIAAQNQAGNQIDSTINWTQAAEGLGQLHAEMAKVQSDEPDHHAALGAVKAAELAAKKGEGNKVLQYLKGGGKYVFDFAQRLAIPILVEIYRRHPDIAASFTP